MFAYCQNNPVNSADPHGDITLGAIGSIAGTIISAAVSVTSYVLTSGGEISLLGLAAAGATGAFSGFLAAQSYEGAAAAGIVSGVYTFFTADGTIAQRLACAGIAFGATFAGGALAYKGGLALLDGVTKLAYGLGSAFINYTVGEISDLSSVALQTVVTNNENNKSQMNNTKNSDNTTTQKNTSSKSIPLPSHRIRNNPAFYLFN